MRVPALLFTLRRVVAATTVCGAVLAAACGGEAPKEPTPAAPTPPSDQRELIWLDRTGARVGTLGVSGRIRAARLAPDGAQVAWLDLDGRIWLRPVAGGDAVALNTGGAHGLAWSPDSARLALDATQPDSRLLLFRLADRTQNVLDATGMGLTISDWSADGQYVAFEQQSEPKKKDIWLLYLKDQTTPVPQVYTDGVDQGAAFSPDSRTIAYTSERNGRSEVFVQPFPVPTLAIRVSYDGGSAPHWSHDGKELFYQSADGLLMVTSISPEPNLSAGETRKLFPLSGVLQQVASDGQRFLVLAPPQ